LNIEIENSYSEDQLDTIEAIKIDTDALSDEMIPLVIEQLRQRLDGFCKQSIALDTFEQITPDVLYSTSLIDYFTALNRIVETYLGLPFITVSAHLLVC
jgi:two-component SAPR family response regulator